MFTIVKRLFSWRREPNYEEELPRLSHTTKLLRVQLLDAQSRNRRWPFLFLATAVMAYLSYVASTLRMSLHTHPRHMAALALTPFFIYAVHQAIRGLTEWRKSQIEARLAKLTERRKRLVEEYKKKTNFDQIQRLVHDGLQDPPTQLQKQQSQHMASHNASTAARAPGTPKINSAQVDSPNGLGLLIGSEKSHSEVEKRAYAVELSKIGASLEAVPVYHTSWVDRILDLLVGENELSPTNRYALICSACHAHNGLAPYGKTADEVSYKCPICGAQNGQLEKLLEPITNPINPHKEQTASDNEVQEKLPAVIMKTNKKKLPETVRKRTPPPPEPASD